MGNRNKEKLSDLIIEQEVDLDLVRKSIQNEVYSYETLELMTNVSKRIPKMMELIVKLNYDPKIEPTLSIIDQRKDGKW